MSREEKKGLEIMELKVKGINRFNLRKFKEREMRGRRYKFYPIILVLPQIT